MWLVAFFRWRRKKEPTASEIADIIERFLEGRSLYPQEWNDFVESRHQDERLEVYRLRCDDLDPLVNSPDPMDPAAVAKLRRMIEELRAQPSDRTTSSSPGC